MCYTKLLQESAMSNLNTIENVIPVVDFILNNIDFYTGYNPKCGYFDAARLDEHKLFTLYDHDGDYRKEPNKYPAGKASTQKQEARKEEENDCEVQQRRAEQRER